MNASERAEFADHAVPGVLILAMAVVALTVGRRQSGGVAMFAAGLLVTLAGIWMTATHAPLVGQAIDHAVSAVAAVHHTLPGLVVVGLGVVWLASSWSDATPPDRPAAPPAEA